MHRTERKTEQGKKSEKLSEQTQRKQPVDDVAELALTMQAILSGESWVQLPAERIYSLSGVLGNAALTEIFALQSTGPELATRVLPPGDCPTVPAEYGGVGEPLLTAAPDYGAMTPLGNTQPLAV